MSCVCGMMYVILMFIWCCSVRLIRGVCIIVLCITTKYKYKDRNVQLTGKLSRKSIRINQMQPKNIIIMVAKLIMLLYNISFQ